MKKNIFLAFLSITIISQTFAQKSDYKSALGLKFYPGGISYKTFIKSNVAIEGVGYFWEYGSRITALYQFYGDIDAVDGLKWYAGFGAHIGFWNDRWKNDYPTRESSLAIGVDGVLGIDYKIGGAPINLSLDWQPSFNLVGYNYFESGWGGLGIRYTF
jgi:hypothetical protein